MDPDIECQMDSSQDRGGYLQSCGESHVWSAPDAAAKGGKRGGGRACWMVKAGTLRRRHTAGTGNTWSLGTVMTRPTAKWN